MNDRLATVIALAFLGVVGIAVVVGGIVLALNDRALPGELIALGSAAVGAIAGVLSLRKLSEA